MATVGFVSLALFLGAAQLASSHLCAAPIVTLPPGLNAGDQYRLVFVSTTVRDATSSDIAEYDDFVTATANLNPSLATLGVSWQVIGSTRTMSARDHIAEYISVPIFLLDGTLIATGTDLWDGTINSAVHVDQFGNVAPGFLVWTGTNPTGGRSTIGALGDTIAALGFSDVSWGGWIEYEPGVTSALELHYYAISAPLVVAPESGSATLMATGVFVLMTVLALGKCRIASCRSLLFWKKESLIEQ